MSRSENLTLIARRRRIRRALKAIGLVLVTGTCGYMWIEGWDFWQSLFFTVITLTTVGYGDYGLSEEGIRFTTILLVGGLSVVTYSAGQIAPMVFDPRLAREWKMKKQAQRLHDHFIICGAGRVGQAACACLAKDDVPFVVIDRDEAAIDLAAERGYVALVGDGTCDEDLEAVGIHRARGLACVTASYTENIVITLGARQLNPDLFIISRAEHDDTIQKMERAGALRVISPIRAGGVTIANTMVRPHLSELLEPSRLSDEGIELAELTVREGSRLDGRTIHECAAAHGSVAFVAVTRPETGTRFRPNADEPLRAGDVLITAGDVIAIGRLQDEARTLRAAA